MQHAGQSPTMVVICLLLVGSCVVESEVSYLNYLHNQNWGISKNSLVSTVCTINSQ